MPLDFRLISMTELRNRPGEILDQVASNGEAFILESNGRRKACLVPLSCFFPDVAPSRIADEMQELLEHGEEPRAKFTYGREFAFCFATDVPEIEIRILLPNGYPNSCPLVYADGLTEDAPHRWANGALCLYGVMTGWNPGRHTVYSTLLLTRQWLSRYNTWRTTGEWPQREESHE